MKTVALLSGGIDSMVASHICRPSGDDCSCAAFINYGQPAVERERVASRDVASELGIARWMEIEIRGLIVPESGFMQGRNLVFASLALATFGAEAGIVVMGLHFGTSYLDCTDAFGELMQGSYNLYTNGSIQFHAPLLGWNKKQVIDYAIKQALPIHLTYSCESSDVPCGRCDSCKDRHAFLR